LRAVPVAALALAAGSPFLPEKTKTTADVLAKQKITTAASIVWLVLPLVLSKSEILKQIKKGNIRITPFRPENVGAVSVDLRLGGWVRVFHDINARFAVEEAAYFSKRFQQHTKKVRLGRGGMVLPPKQLVLGATKERIALSGCICGKIEGRSRFARMGLMVHVSSSLVQPGVDNVQVLEILNLSPFELVLLPGAKICQIMFEEVQGEAEYSGNFKKQRGV